MTDHEKAFETMIAREAFDLISLATFLGGLFLAGLALATLM